MTIKTVSSMVAAAVLGIGCGSPQPTAPHPGHESASDAIRAWIQQLPAAYEKGDATIFDHRIDPDGLFISTAPEEVWDAPTFIDLHHEMLGKVAAGQIRWKVAIKDLLIGEAPDGKSAWMTMEVDWRFGDRPETVPSRWSGVMIERDGRWALSASEVSFAVPDAEAFQLAAAGKLVASKPIADKIDPGAEELLAVFDRDLAAPINLVTDLSDRPEVSMLGTAPADHMVDGAAIKKVMQAHLADMHETLKRAGVRAHLAPGGQLGWLMTTVEDTVEPKPGTHVVLPLRTLAVYVREGGAWKLVHWHSSNAVPNG